MGRTGSLHASGTRRPARAAPGGRSGERGAALLVVMVAVAVLTALAVDLAYDTRVSLRIAGNARDELRATYLAKSGVALQRLVLSFQQDVDAAIQLPAAAGQAPAMPRPQVWRIVPVGSALAASLFGEQASGAAPAAARPRPTAAPARATAPAGASPSIAGAGGGPEQGPQSRPAGPPPDGFEAVVDDEGRKVNVQLDALGTNPILAAQVQAFWQLVCDPRWDALFDQEDEKGLRVSRQDLLVYLRDWVDDLDQGSALVASFPATCVMLLATQNAFEQGFQDENFPYDRGEDRYRTKNARMDSLAELYLVAGVTDAFMAAFGDALTVYLPRDAKRNVNETDRMRLLDLARIVASPPSQPALYDPEFADRLQKVVLERTYGGMLSLTPVDFVQIVAALGVKVNQDMLSPTSTQNPFTDRSTVFRIRSAARVGDVTKVLDGVFRFGQAQSGQATSTAGQPGAATGRGASSAGQGAAAALGQAAAAALGRGAPTSLGQLVHWRED
jgi:general secretion pathway protein K